MIMNGMYFCKGCGIEVSGLGRCEDCSEPLCMFCAVFIKDGVDVGMLAGIGAKHYCPEHGTAKVK